MPGRTIQRNITLRALGSVAAILVAAGVVANLVITNWLSAEFDKAMLTKAQVLVTLFEEDTFGMEFEFADEVMPEFGRIDDPEYFQFRTPEGENFERSTQLMGRDLPFFSEIGADVKYANTILPDGRPGRLLQMVFVPQLELELRTAERRVSQYVMVIGLARERVSLDHRIFLVDLSLIVLGLLILISVYFALAQVISRGLAPLEAIKQEVENLDSSDMSQRLLIGVPLLDLEKVVVALNDLLARIESGFEREKRFSVGAAHELKTPIAELMNMSEVFQRWPNADEAPQFAADVLASAKRMQFIVESLLRLARGRLQAYNPETEGEDITLLSSVQKAIGLISKDAQARELSFDITGDSATAIFSSALDLDLMLSNVLGNAVAHADRGTTLAIILAENSLSITNAARTLTEDDLPMLFESLWRKDEARTSEFHVGLGLSIVQAYAERLGIELGVFLQNGEFTITFKFPHT
jgi:two-component system heavy metal sensor histidine kinase CusS